MILNPKYLVGSPSVPPNKEDPSLQYGDINCFMRNYSQIQIVGRMLGCNLQLIR